MGVYIPNMEHPKDGLYQIDHGKIHKYKGKGGTVRVYPIQEIDIITCGECKKHGKNSCPMTFTYAVITDDNNYCTYAERRTDETLKSMKEAEAKVKGE